MGRQIYFFIVIICVVQTKELYEGDSCTVSGSNGVCKNINVCPSAIEDIRNKIMPQVCSYGISDPIVCCKLSSAAPEPNVPTTTEYEPEYNDYEENVSQETEASCPPLDPDLTAPKTGQKAWDKCVEYQEEYIYPCKKSLTFTGGFVRERKCKHSAKKYIVGGEDAEGGEFPHMAMLGYLINEDNANKKIDFSCGGSVISDWFILTAGHCIHGGRLGPVVYALVGTLKRSDNYNPDNLYELKRIIKHPGYASPKKYNDIALLETDRRIKLSSFVVPACLDVGKESAETAVATGWGATMYRGSIADTLQKVNISKFDDSECGNWHKPNRHMEKGFDTRTQICYGDRKQSKDTCGGDSGGPLQVQSKHLHCMYVVVGVTSFGKECGNIGQPGVYTRVLEYLPWIESVVWP